MSLHYLSIEEASDLIRKRDLCKCLQIPVLPYLS